MEFVLLLLGVAAVIAIVYFFFYLIKQLIKYKRPGAIGSVVINIFALLGAIAFNVVEEELSVFGVMGIALFNAMSFVVVRGHRFCLDMDSERVSLSEIFSIISALFKATLIFGAAYVIIGYYAKFSEILFIGCGVIFVLIGQQIYIDFFRNKN